MYYIIIHAILTYIVLNKSIDTSLKHILYLIWRPGESHHSFIRRWVTTMVKSSIILYLFLNIIAVSFSNTESINISPGEHKTIKSNGTVRTISKFYVLPNSASSNDSKNHDEMLQKMVNDKTNNKTGYVKKTYKFVFGKRKPSIRDDEEQNDKYVDLTRKLGKDMEQNEDKHVYWTEHFGKKSSSVGDNILSQSENIKILNKNNLFKDNENSYQYDNSSNDSINMNSFDENGKKSIEFYEMLHMLKQSKEKDKAFYINETNHKESQVNTAETLNKKNKVTEINDTILNDNLNQNNTNIDVETKNAINKTSDHTNNDEILFLKAMNEVHKESDESFRNKDQKISRNAGDEVYFDENSYSNENYTVELFIDKNESLENKSNYFSHNDVSSDITAQNKLSVVNDNLKVIPLQSERNRNRNEKNHTTVDVSGSSVIQINNDHVSSASGSTSSIPETYALTETNVEENLYQNSIGNFPINQNVPYKLEESNNSEDEIKAKDLLSNGNRDGPSDDDQINSIISMMNLQDINAIKNIEKAVLSCISQHCKDIKIMLNGNKPEYHIFVQKICEAATQNVVDFWKVLANYLGLEKVHREGLLETEKLYLILTVFTQLSKAIDFGNPIENTIDKIVELLQPLYGKHKSFDEIVKIIINKANKGAIDSVIDPAYFSDYPNHNVNPHNDEVNDHDDYIKTNPKIHTGHAMSISHQKYNIKPNTATYIHDRHIKSSPLVEKYPTIFENPAHFKYLDIDNESVNKQPPMKIRKPHEDDVDVPPSEIPRIVPDQKVKFHIYPKLNENDREVFGNLNNFTKTKTRQVESSEHVNNHLPIRMLTRQPNVLASIPNIDESHKVRQQNVQFYPNLFKVQYDDRERYKDVINSDKSNYDERLKCNESDSDRDNGYVAIRYLPEDDSPYPKDNGKFSTVEAIPHRKRNTLIFSKYLPEDSIEYYQQFDKIEGLINKVESLKQEKKDDIVSSIKIFAKPLEEIPEFDKKIAIEKYPKESNDHKFTGTPLPRLLIKVKDSDTLLHNSPFENHQSINDDNYPSFHQPQGPNENESADNEVMTLINEIIISLKRHLVPDNVVNEVVLKIHKIKVIVKESVGECE